MQVLVDRFINCKMCDEEKMADYVARVVGLAQRLKDMDLEQKDPVIIAKIIGSLPEKYDNIRTVWYTVPKVDQTIERLTYHLINEEALLNARSQSNNQNSEALAVNTKKYSSKKFKNVSTKKPEKCNYCHIPGHWARDCGKKKQAKQNNESLIAKSNSWNSFKDADNANLLLVNSTTVNASREEVWYADSVATEHMSFCKKLFKNFKQYDENTYTVKVCNGTQIDVRGRGDVDISVMYANGTSKVFTITNVLFVPELSKNLLSIMKTTERGVEVTFKEGGQRVIFKKDNKLIMDGVKCDNLYKLEIRPISVSESHVVISDSVKLWHERLGHVNYSTLKQMRDNKVVNDLSFCDVANDPFCESCVYGKQHRQFFPRTVRRSTVPGKVFHADLCGKMSTASIGGANYFLLLKDDFARYCYIYFLKNETEVLKNLELFLAEVQADGHKIKKLRTDNGLEFCNENVERFLRKNVIKHETSTPRAPEQNGFIERQNRTIVESAKSIVHSRDVPRYLWAEAANAAVYIKNRTASRTLDGLTPYERWFNVKPSVKHLRVFGSCCYVHVPNEQRTKWDVNSIKCMLIGYSEGNKAYRVYDPTAKKIMIRRDVIFNEVLPQETIVEDFILEFNEPQPKHYEQCAPSKEEKTERVEKQEVTPRRNPRLPIPRSSYPKRRNSRTSDDVNTEQAIIAETYMLKSEPNTFEEALEGEDTEKWSQAIKSKLDSLIENHTWTLVPRPKDINVISNRWVFKQKLDKDGKLDKYKALLVAKGYTQQHEIDYEETFSPVVKYSTVQMMLSIAAARNYEIFQFDVKTAFLHGELDRPIYMEQPSGCKKEGDSVCLLNKAIYGLKQASMCWNKKIVKFLTDWNFIQSKADRCVFMEIDKKLYLALYMDDGLLCSENIHGMNALLSDLNREFTITYSKAEFFVGMQIERGRDGGQLKIHQSSMLRRY